MAVGYMNYKYRFALHSDRTDNYTKNETALALHSSQILNGHGVKHIIYREECEEEKEENDRR
jgi:hypothetical protein